MPPLPTITGGQLRRLLERDGWIVGRSSRHGYSMSKKVGGRRRVTVVRKRGEIVPGTLAAILGPLQTGIGRAGLERLIRQHKLK